MSMHRHVSYVRLKNQKMSSTVSNLLEIFWLILFNICIGLYMIKGNSNDSSDFMWIAPAQFTVCFAMEPIPISEIVSKND